MARQTLDAAEAGHEWLVAGYPGPVSPDGKKVGPLTNVPGLARSEFNVSEEMAAVEPALGRLIESGFMIVNSNDGSLAAQAAASRIGEHKYRKVAALIDGTGTGAGVVVADAAHEKVYRTDNSSPLEIGHVVLSGDPFDTYERSVSGSALERTYGQDPREMSASHPAWRKVGTSIGQMATTLGIMHGAELVVPCGGVGAGASDMYGPHLDSMMTGYREYGNGPQQLFAPDVMPVPVEDAQIFELFGAEGIMRDYLTRAA
jgi:predicted NBD/HSP70 family sugar kinase